MVTYIYYHIICKKWYFDFFLSNLFPLDLLLLTNCSGYDFKYYINRYSESSQPFLVPDFSGIASSFFPFSLILATGLLYIVFTMFRYGPWIPDLSKTFIMKGCWTLEIRSWHLMKWSCVFFSFEFVYIVDYIDGFP